MTRKEILEIVKKEGFYEAFESNGLKCRIIRPRLDYISIEINECFNFHWCGYVGVNKEHPFYGKGYNDEIDDSGKKIYEIFDVHGGITYASNKLHMQPEKDLWWFGFDCSHYGDMSMFGQNNPPLNEIGVYRNKEYVIEETKSLAKQLSEIALLK